MKMMSNPFDQFAAWFEQVRQTAIDKPNAMTLSTVDSKARPHARIVLLSSFDNHGFVFHTNYNSSKGSHIANNPHVALSFWWDEPGYQVTINGIAEKTSGSESDAYFAGRPRGSQIGAWASEQSQVIDSRETLESRLARFKEKFYNSDVPRPPHWGGYRVIPEEFEFWINGADRLHDRFRYRKDAQGIWQHVRLSP